MATVFDKIGTDRTLQDHWLRRLIAGIIDWIITLIIAWIISMLVQLPASFFQPIALVGPSEFLHGVIFVLYALFMESSRGTTLGKQIMNLRVNTTQGGLPNLYTSFIRNISKIHLVLWLIDTLIGMATAGDPHQKYSDRFAGTTVASTLERGLILPSPPSPPSPPTPSTSA